MLEHAKIEDGQVVDCGRFSVILASSVLVGILRVGLDVDDLAKCNLDIVNGSWAVRVVDVNVKLDRLICEIERLCQLSLNFYGFPRVASSAAKTLQDSSLSLERVVCVPRDVLNRLASVSEVFEQMVIEFAIIRLLESFHHIFVTRIPSKHWLKDSLGLKE